MISPMGMPLISYFICCSGGSLRMPGPVAVSRSALAKLWIWARSRTRTVVCVCSGELGRSSAPAVGREPEGGSHREALSAPGDGMALLGVGTIVASVLVDEALDGSAADDPGRGGFAADAMY